MSTRACVRHVMTLHAGCNMPAVSKLAVTALCGSLVVCLVDGLGSETNCVLQRGSVRQTNYVLQVTLGLADILLLAEGLGRKTNNVLQRG